MEGGNGGDVDRWREERVKHTGRTEFQEHTNYTAPGVGVDGWMVG